MKVHFSSQTFFLEYVEIITSRDDKVLGLKK